MTLLYVVQSKRKSDEISSGNLVKDTPTVSESLTGSHSSTKFNSITMIVGRLPLASDISTRWVSSRVTGFAFRTRRIGALCLYLSRAFLRVWVPFFFLLLHIALLGILSLLALILKWSIFWGLFFYLRLWSFAIMALGIRLLRFRISTGAFRSCHYGIR